MFSDTVYYFQITSQTSAYRFLIARNELQAAFHNNLQKNESESKKVWVRHLPKHTASHPENWNLDKSSRT